MLFRPWICCFVALAVTGLLGGCKSYALLSVKDMEKVQTSNKGRTFYLKQPFFVGPFFSYSDLFYISERAFDERVLLQNISGDPILPSQPVAILPMGTKVRVLEIEFPTSLVQSNRKLKSPRHFTWVKVEPVDNQLDKPAILVLTQEFIKISEFDQALKYYLSEKDPMDETPAWSPEEQNAINQKKLIKGMHASGLIRSRGHPDRITRKFIEGVKIEHWQYGSNRVVVLKEDSVDSWKGFPHTSFDVISPGNQ